MSNVTNIINLNKAKQGQYLSFILNEQLYAVPIETVREINRVTNITKVPQTADFVAGVINLRGKVIPVVDLRLKFKLPNAAYTKQTSIIVIDGQDGQIGMIVDATGGVLELSSEQIEPAPSMGNTEELSFVIGMAKVESSVLILIDIVNALSREQLSGIVSAAPGLDVEEVKKWG